jgi:hypothetical protein
MEGMTINQIAELCGVGRRTVERWINKSSAKMAEGVRQNVVGGVRQDVQPFGVIKQKTLEAASKGEEAVFPIEEVIAIIRAGGKNTLAELLADNAQRKETALALRDSVQALIPQITAAVVQAVRSAPALLAPPIPEMPPGYYTIKQYGITRGMWIGISTAVFWGRHASDISRSRGIEIKKIKVPGSEIAQEVNAYHVSVLQEIFTL